jgi:hypothetical protein
MTYKWTCAQCHYSRWKVLCSQRSILQGSGALLQRLNVGLPTEVLIRRTYSWWKFSWKLTGQGKGKGKSKTAPRHEGVLGEWRYSSTYSLTSTLDGGKWSASCHGRFTPRERTPGTHWIGGWLGTRAGLDAMVKRKIPSPYQDSNSRSSSP